MHLSQSKRAMLYTAMKLLGQVHDNEADKCEVEPGTAHSMQDVTITITRGDETITVKAAPGTMLTRDTGMNGDGTEDKRMPQRMFGTAILANALLTCDKFRQAEKVKKVMLRIVRRAIRQATDTKSSIEKELTKKQLRELEAMVKELRDNAPKQANATARKVETPKKGMLPTVTVKGQAKAA